jgi:7,8-dihydro-6-hydroxymethylpterin dimethyltransferase
VSIVPELLERVSSLCPTCNKPAMADIVEREDRIYQRPVCPEHEHEPRMIFSHAGLYRRLESWNRTVFGEAGEARPGGLEACGDDEGEGKPPLLAVIDLTNRCNFRCPVCFAETPADDHVYYLEFETVRRMLTALLAQGPVPCRHIQFSGGEPTLHPRFLDIVRMAREMGFNHIQVATNGSLFGRQEFVQRCEEAGLHTLYLQFDGMTDEVYLALRGQRLLEQKLRVVENISRSSLRLVLVPTVVPGVNVDQLGAIFTFALRYSHHVTGISIQPMANTGRVGVPASCGESFNLADMAEEFGRQTGLTRMPDDWFPLNGLSLLTRAVSRLRNEPMQNPACDAQCSVGTYFHVDDADRPTCLTRFLDLEKLLRTASALEPVTGGVIRRQISKLRQFTELSSAFDPSQAPRGLSFERLLRGLDGWEDKTVGRGRDWFSRGFNGLFVAGMHFMDAGNYSYRRARRCIIKYVTVEGEVVSFCRYNAGERRRTGEDASRLVLCQPHLA